MSLEEELHADGRDFETRLPTYCNFHKFLLVEEIILEDDYRQLHCGKCRVIGRVQKTSTFDFFLENVPISNLPEEYSLPEGTIKLYLQTLPNAHPTLEHGKYVEILGELILLNLNATNQEVALTSRGVVEQLQLVSKTEDKEKLLNYFKKHYKAAIKVWYVNQINRVSDLISRFLEMRMLEQAITPN